MEMVEQMSHHTTGEWAIEHRESEVFTTIAGLLMTSGHMGIIAVRAMLTDDEKQRIRAALHQRLMDTPIGTSTVVFCDV